MCRAFGSKALNVVTGYSAAVDLEAHADALLPGRGTDPDVASQSRFGEEGSEFICRVVVPLKNLKRRRGEF